MNYVIEYIKGFLGFPLKDSKLNGNHYIISFKDTGLKDIKPEDVKEFGLFRVYGTSGIALQGSSELTKDDLRNKFAQKFDIPVDKVIVISPIIFMGLRGWIFASRLIPRSIHSIKEDYKNGTSLAGFQEYLDTRLQQAEDFEEINKSEFSQAEHPLEKYLIGSVVDLVQYSNGLMRFTYQFNEENELIGFAITFEVRKF